MSKPTFKRLNATPLLDIDVGDYIDHPRMLKAAVRRYEMPWCENRDSVLPDATAQAGVDLPFHPGHIARIFEYRTQDLFHDVATHQSTVLVRLIRLDGLSRAQTRRDWTSNGVVSQRQLTEFTRTTQEIIVAGTNVYTRRNPTPGQTLEFVPRSGRFRIQSHITPTPRLTSVMEALTGLYRVYKDRLDVGYALGLSEIELCAIHVQLHRQLKAARATYIHHYGSAP